MITFLEKALINKLEEVAYENERLSKQNNQFIKVIQYAQGLCEEIIENQTKGKQTQGQCVYFKDISVTGILADINKALEDNNA